MGDPRPYESVHFAYERTPIPYGSDAIPLREGVGYPPKMAILDAKISFSAKKRKKGVS